MDLHAYAACSFCWTPSQGLETATADPPVAATTSELETSLKIEIESRDSDIQTLVNADGTSFRDFVEKMQQTNVTRDFGLSVTRRGALFVVHTFFTISIQRAAEKTGWPKVAEEPQRVNFTRGVSTELGVEELQADLARHLNT